MPTLYDLSRMMGGSGSRVGSTTPSRDASVGGVSGGQSGSSSSVRYGYALADSADGWVAVQLDTGQLIGGDSTVQCVCDSPISRGQRVAVDVMPNGQLKARPIGTNIIDSAVDDAVGQAGQNAIKSVEIQWAPSTSGTSAPSTGWSGDYPEDASYVWQRTVTTYGSGQTETSTPVLVDWPRESNARETVYAHSTTGPTTAAKNATIDSGTLDMAEGAVVSVTFTYANTASSPSLNVGGKGSKPIRTNGTPYAYWAAGATVLFVYDGTYWQVASTPVYASTVTVGNPAGMHTYIDQGGVELRNGSTPMATFGQTETHLGMGASGARVMLMNDTFQIAAESSSFGGNNLIISPRDQSVDQTGDYVNVNSILILRDVNTYMAMQGGSTVFESREDYKIRCPSGNVGIYGDGIWMGTTGSIVKPGGMMGGNSVMQSLPSSNVTFSANSYYDCFTGETATGGVSAVFYRSGSYMYIWLPRAAAGSSSLATPVLVSGMASAANVDNTNFAASLEVTRYSGSGSLMSQGTLAMGIQTGSSTGAFCTLTCPSALVMLGRSTSGPTIYRMRMMGRSSNGSATLQSWYMTAHLM